MTSSEKDVSIEFFKGTKETVIPEIRLTRSKDGRTGQAIFTFEEPSALTSEDYKKIQGMYLIDNEGEIVTRDVNIRVSNGKKKGIEAIYKWRTDQDFDRFMRFANRYAKANSLSYKGDKNT